MNNIYMICKIESIGEFCFDYYNTLKPYCILKCVELEDSLNVFDFLLYDKICVDYINKVKLNDNILVYGSAIINIGKLYILAKEVYIL